jgi:hypothetical protein
VEPRVPWETCCPSTSGLEEPILNESEDAHVQDLLKYAREHASEMEFNAIFSQVALATSLKYLPVEGTVKGGVLAEAQRRENGKSQRPRFRSLNHQR